MTTLALSGWRGVVQLLRSEPPGVTLRLPKGHLPHPRTFRMTPTIGLPEGQWASYRKVLRDGAGLTVKDFGEHYEIRIEAVGASPVHEPASIIAGGTALGALFGSAFGRSQEGVVAAAAVGGMLAALFADRADRIVIAAD
jgi:hypothetical protein